jgi:hypothetical protein
MSATFHTAGNGTSQEATVIDGHTIDYGLRHQSIERRTEVARGLMSGEVTLGHLKPSQAAALCRVPYDTLNGRKPKAGEPRFSTIKICSWWNTADPIEREALIKALGIASVWDTLDNLTR